MFKQTQFYWELIADKISGAGYSIGWCKHGNESGSFLWCADAKKDGRHFVAWAENLTVAFAELEKALEADELEGEGAARLLPGRGGL
jgi:hypothetical protein